MEIIWLFQVGGIERNLARVSSSSAGPTGVPGMGDVNKDTGRALFSDHEMLELSRGPRDPWLNCMVTFQSDS